MSDAETDPREQPSEIAKSVERVINSLQMRIAVNESALNSGLYEGEMVAAAQAVNSVAQSTIELLIEALESKE